MVRSKNFNDCSNTAISYLRLNLILSACSHYNFFPKATFFNFFIQCVIPIGIIQYHGIVSIVDFILLGNTDTAMDEDKNDNILVALF